VQKPQSLEEILAGLSEMGFDHERASVSLEALLCFVNELDSDHPEFADTCWKIYSSLDTMFIQLLAYPSLRLLALKVILWLSSIEPQDGMAFGLRLLEVQPDS
jgi:hypothetical protein